jgi:hypothetical protein
LPVLTGRSSIITSLVAGEIQPVAIRRIGPDLVFARLWKESGIPEVLRSVLKAVIGRLSVGGRIILSLEPKAFQLHHLYRAMAFLGDPIEQLDKPAGN